MSEFKFNCPDCGQHILANENWVGRRVNCPSCNTRIAIPPPPKEPGKGQPVMPSAPTARSRLPVNSSPADISAKEARTATSPTPALPVPGKEEQATGTSPPKQPKKNQPVTPPAPTARPKLPGGPVQAALPAEEAGTLTAPAPVLPTPGRESQAARTSPPKEPKKNQPVTPPPVATAQPKLAASPLRVELPAPEAAIATAPAPATPAPRKEGHAAKTAPAAPRQTLRAAGDAPQQPEQLRVAALSPAVKVELVRAVRRRIADESAWLPGKVKGATAYAAKKQNGELVLLEAGSPEATQLSLIGAFLREMQERRVVRTAIGRRRFLDEEIPDAIREVLLEQMSDEEREHAEDRLAARDLLSISHAQCLAVLDALEERYSQRVEQLQIERAKRRLGNIRLPDLVKKLEKKVPISPEEVATALYHELMEVRRRLERIEARLTREQSASTHESG